MNKTWTSERAWDWQNKTGWLRGCNFIGSDCCSRIDMWQSHNNAQHMRTAERELALCRDIGFNTVRLIVEFDVWLQERASFMEILESYIALYIANKDMYLAEAKQMLDDILSFYHKDYYNP